MGILHIPGCDIALTGPYSKRWIIDRATLRQARAEDLLYVEDSELLDLLNIFFADSQYMHHYYTARCFSIFLG